jgi:EmrB/QacA subfamily drug resistance transporter
MLTLVAMTLANSMILVDQTAVPLAIPRIIGGLDGSYNTSQWILTANVLALAAFMVFGGRLGDLLGLRRVFLAGAGIFIVSSALAGAAQDMNWLIAVRATQGFGAALMMPTTMAIVAAVFPEDARGRALGTMAGASAFFAAAGPIIGGLLVQLIDWRAVFYVNVPLAAITILITLVATPDLRPAPGMPRSIDLPGVVAFAIGIGAFVLGLGQSQDWGFTSRATLGCVGVGVVALVAFSFIERRQEHPLIQFKLFRHLNYLASNLSQVLAGFVELGLGLLLPFYLLLIIGYSPATAGIALIPATVPIIVVAPLAGKWFDRSGGRPPLVHGFAILAASSFYLAWAVQDINYTLLIPGLVLQGIGLGIVLTVNDPTGINAIPEDSRGQGSGVIDTTEQLGGSLGISLLSVGLLWFYRMKADDFLGDHGISLSKGQISQFKDFILDVEQTGRRQATVPIQFQDVWNLAGQAWIDAFSFVLVISGAVALAGAVISLILVRKGDRVSTGPVFSRRSRWVYATAGRTPGLTKKPVPSVAAGDDPPQTRDTS